MRKTTSLDNGSLTQAGSPWYATTFGQQLSPESLTPACSKILLAMSFAW
jgi:hypothetical protein